ncbi:protein FAM228A [Cavia porcellus]|uniref:protein FAM228A n=1 Tax=Cavia porcellus TaxID=10141 RepID=UPI002FE369C0
MAAGKAPRCCQRRPELLRAWPGPTSASDMEALARADIDQAVHVLLSRESYVVRSLDSYLQHLDMFKKRRKEMLHKKWVETVAEPLRQRIAEKVTLLRGREKTKQENADYHCNHARKSVTVPPFAGPLFQRQQKAEEEKKSGPRDGTGRRCSTKELKHTDKAGLRARLPQGPSPGLRRPPEAWYDTARRPGAHSACMQAVASPELLTGAEEQLLQGEELTSDLSQILFERQFRRSRLSRETTGAAEKVLGAQQQRPRSWAAGDHRQRRGSLSARGGAMTAEVLGQHLVSLQAAARPPSAFHCR